MLCERRGKRMTVRCLAYGSQAYRAELELRDEVLRRPLGLSIWDDCREGEGEEIHLGAFAGEALIGTLILTPGEGLWRMRQVAVRPGRQGKGVGRKLAEFGEALAREWGARGIYLHARETARGFYERCGYRAVGEEFLERGIPHVEMEKRFG